MLILRNGYFRTQWKAYSFGKVRSFWSWQLRELILTLALTMYHLFVFFCCFLPQLIAVQVLERMKNTTNLQTCFALLFPSYSPPLQKDLPPLVAVVVKYH